MTENKIKLKAQMGLFTTISVVINRIIGSGIFRTPAPIMLLTASLIPFYSVWIIGGIATLLSALCYAEMVAMMPASGGPYVYLKKAYPPIIPFLRGWAMFFVNETGSIVAVTIFFSENLLHFFPEFQGGVGQAIVSLFVIWFLSFLNARGLQMSAFFQNFFSLIKLLVLLIIIVVGIYHFDSATFIGSGAFFSDTKFNWITILAIGQALRYGFFAYSGWEGATYVAEEVKNPERNLPLSIFIGIGLVMVIYMLVNTAYLGILGTEQLALSKSAAVTAMQKVFGTGGALFIAIAIMISTFTNVNTQIFCKTRTWFAMSRDGMFFEKLKYLHPKYLTPNNATWLQAVWASVLLLFATSSENAYESIIDYFAFTSGVFNTLTFAALWVLRIKMPKANRPYKAWGFPYTLIIVLAIQVFFMVTTLITSFTASLFGIALTCTGLIYYFMVVKKRFS